MQNLLKEHRDCTNFGADQKGMKKRQKEEPESNKKPVAEEGVATQNGKDTRSIKEEAQKKRNKQTMETMVGGIAEMLALTAITMLVLRGR